MMDWTDRHCRYFHRLLSGNALLFTEMVTAAALVRGGAAHLLAHDPAEHPVAIQLGGSEPGELARAAALAEAAGFPEVNLNVGCPSDRVQSGCFGAVLMKRPGLVAECVAAMRDALDRSEVTVKCRIGVDDQEPRTVLPRFLETMAEVGIRRVIVHARKAWLDGLSPKENRDIPPLDHDLVIDMKRAFPQLHISINGGITSIAQAQEMLAAGLDGVMIGRAAYHAPYEILGAADAAIWHGPPAPTAVDVARAMMPYVDAHVARGGRVHGVTRHMLGLFAGRPGARAWRRHLSQAGTRPGADGRVIAEALTLVESGRLAAAE